MPALASRLPSSASSRRMRTATSGMGAFCKTSRLAAAASALRGVLDDRLFVRELLQARPVDAATAVGR